MKMYIKKFGKKVDSKKFDEQFVHSIGLAASETRVTQIVLNGHEYGLDKGTSEPTLVFDEDEYICSVDIRHGSDVDYVKFTTNKGRSIEGGDTGGELTQLKNVRVIAIGGYWNYNVHRDGGFWSMGTFNVGSIIDQLSIRYIQDFEPSKVIEKNIKVILGYVAPNTTLKGYKSEQSRMLEAYSKTLQNKSSYSYSASVEAEFYVKASASTNLTFENSSEESINNELEKQKASGDEYENKIDGNHIGLILASGTIMESQGGHWIMPSTSNYAVIELKDAADSLSGHYDLTGTLSSQIKELKKNEIEQYNIQYFK